MCMETHVLPIVDEMSAVIWHKSVSPLYKKVLSDTTPSCPFSSPLLCLQQLSDSHKH